MKQQGTKTLLEVRFLYVCIIQVYLKMELDCVLLQNMQWLKNIKHLDLYHFFLVSLNKFIHYMYLYVLFFGLEGITVY